MKVTVRRTPPYGKIHFPPVHQHQLTCPSHLQTWSCYRPRNTQQTCSGSHAELCSCLLLKDCCVIGQKCRVGVVSGSQAPPWWMISFLPGEWKWWKAGRAKKQPFPNFGNKGCSAQVVLRGSRFCCQNPDFAARIPLVWVELVADHWPATGSLVDLWDVFLSYLFSELIKILLIFLLAVVDGFSSVGMIKASVVFWVQPSLNIQNFCRFTLQFGKAIKLCVYVLKIISSLLRI